MRSLREKRRTADQSGAICSSSCPAQVSTHSNLLLHLCLCKSASDWHWHIRIAVLRCKDIVRQMAFLQLRWVKARVIWEASMLSAFRRFQTCSGCQAARLTKARAADAQVMALFAPAWLPLCSSGGCKILNAPGQGQQKVCFSGSITCSTSVRSFVGASLGLKGASWCRGGHRCKPKAYFHRIASLPAPSTFRKYWTAYQYADSTGAGQAPFESIDPLLYVYRPATARVCL